MVHKKIFIGCIALIVLITSSCSVHKQHRHKYHTPFVYFVSEINSGDSDTSDFLIGTSSTGGGGCSFLDSDTIYCIPINTDDTIKVKENAVTGVFKIIKIENERNIYRITLQRDSIYYYRYFNEYDSSFRDTYFSPVYEVYTVKLENFKGYKKIKKGKKYALTLNPYFEYDYAKYKYRSEVIDVRPVDIKGKHIGIGIGTTAPNIYTSPNIDGLYYIPCK
jgi:hypothetical protein